MDGCSEAPTVMTEQGKADETDRFAKANGRLLGLTFGIQSAIFEQVVFANTEFMDRARTETHLLAEFISKMAGSHSVKDMSTVNRECCQHQIDFIRRDCDRLFKHGQKIIEATSELVCNQISAAPRASDEKSDRMALSKC